MFHDGSDGLTDVRLGGTAPHPYTFSNSLATSSRSFRMGRCWGQTFSHLPHFTQSEALLPGRVWISL